MRLVRWLVWCVLFLSAGVALASEDVLKSTAEEQIRVEVTVYNSNLGLIKDTRRVTIPQGSGELRFMDVPASIMPVTVQVKSINSPETFSVLEQNYEYDLISRSKLLDKYVGKQIKLIDWNKIQDRKDVVEATLLSNNQGPIYVIDKEIFLGHPGQPVLPKLPENLIAKPTLTWLYKNTTEKPHELEVSYLTEYINWKADYIVAVDKNDTSADISGWVTLDNKSGAMYKDARLKLVAGQLHRVQDVTAGLAPPREMARKARGDAQFTEQPFFEYHIYDLQRKTTIKDKQTKQVRLLEAYGVALQKELLVYGIKSYFTVRFTERQPKQPVSVYLTFKNSQENKLGMPLPAGIMRAYKQDEKGSRQFVGEDRIEHTPKNEEVRLKIGRAFDVVAERTQTDFKQLTSRLYESEWEIKLRNHKNKDVSVGIIEPLTGTWELIQKTHPYKKVDAFTIRFDVKVPKDEEVAVKYRVRVGT